MASPAATGRPPSSPTRSRPPASPDRPGRRAEGDGPALGALDAVLDALAEAGPPPLGAPGGLP
ncbi:hypothetical protein GCM10010360_10170 [Streptomyces nogalater]